MARASGLTVGAALSDESWPTLLARQDRVVSRAQALAHGWSDERVGRRLADERWQRLHPGVYLAGPAPPDHAQLVWGALLAIGGEVAASHESALWLAGHQRAVPNRVHVAVPDGRHVRRPAGTRVHSLPALEPLLHPASEPPRVRLERATIDVAHALRDVRPALGAVYAVLQDRLTTPDRLERALLDRPRHRHRKALQAVLVDAGGGALSGMERRHLALSRQHGLPAGQRQRKAAGTVGNRYLDVLYDEAGMREQLVTELDGRTGHDLADQRFRDMGRDNLDEDLGRGHLRYGTGDVFGDPCQVAAQTAKALWRRGWTGTARRCGPSCTLVLP